MNRVALEKRINILIRYKEKIDTQADLANHLFNETKKRINLITLNIKEKEVLINSLSGHFQVGEKDKGLLANVYGYVRHVESELFTLKEDFNIASIEYERRLNEYKILKVKSIGLEGLIERHKKEISELDMIQDRIFLDEWLVQSSLAKGK